VTTRERLPNRRVTTTHKVKIGRRSHFVSVGHYPDGRPGEVFVDTAKAGSEARALMHSLGMMISLALQHGCPVEEITDALSDFRDDEFPAQLAALLCASEGQPVAPTDQENSASANVFPVSEPKEEE
jgi:hypothetical protein